MVVHILRPVKVSRILVWEPRPWSSCGPKQRARNDTSFIKKVAYYLCVFSPDPIGMNINNSMLMSRIEPFYASSIMR